MALDITFDCLEMMVLVVSKMEMNNERIKQAMIQEMNATEEAYELVERDMSFWEAYRIVGNKCC